MAWLPLCMDAAELILHGFGWDDWQDMTYSALREFVAFEVVHTPQPQEMPASTRSSTFLAFEPFAIFDCGWSRACWVALERDFRARMTGEFPGASRSRIAYLGIWLLVPWVLGSIIYRTYRIAPGSPEFVELEDGFARGIIERAPFKFDEELADDHDYLAAVRVPPRALPSGFWRMGSHGHSVQGLREAGG
ncbi:hypothetical protein V1524DRAFT_448771 [Lipomyces starkeyi]